jgi:hypothetical protein
LARACSHDDECRLSCYHHFDGVSLPSLMVNDVKSPSSRTTARALKNLYCAAESRFFSVNRFLHLLAQVFLFQ